MKEVGGNRSGRLEWMGGVRGWGVERTSHSGGVERRVFGVVAIPGGRGRGREALWPFCPSFSSSLSLFPVSSPTALTMDLTGGEGRCGQAWGAVSWQRRARAWPWRGPVVCVHGQLVPKGFFLAPVGKPVVDTHLCNKVGA